MDTLPWLVVALALLLAAGLAFLQTGGVVDGTFPVLHLGESWGFTLAEVPDLFGQTALVTGASSGLGLGVATILAQRGATLLVTARSDDKCSATLAAIAASGSRGPAAAKPCCVVLELLSLAAVDKAAAEIAERMPHIDLFVANAGIMMPPSLLRSADGHEAQFATNHLGHFRLAQLLMPALSSGNARVVAVSSVAHFFAPAAPLLTEAALNDAVTYGRVAWYGWSKLCNLLWVRGVPAQKALAASASLSLLDRAKCGAPVLIWQVRELNRRYPDLTAHAVHPGGVRGKLLRFAGLPDAVVRGFERAFYWDPADAALTVLRPLLADEYGSKRGRYLVPIGRERRSSKMAADAALGARLWEFSEQLVAAAGGGPAAPLPQT